MVLGFPNGFSKRGLALKKFFITIFVSFLGLHNCALCNVGGVAIQLGDTHSEKVWVYLSGLIDHFYTPLELSNRQNLDEIGKRLGLKIIAIEPTDRRPEFNNQLCWPHSSVDETLYTLAKIKRRFGDQVISGFIGFSNGGFFLNNLAQVLSLGAPVISIGSGGYVHNTSINNQIFLLIGKQDHYHYQYAKDFYLQAQATSLDVKLLEYEEGHVFPYELVEDLLTKITGERGCTIQEKRFLQLTGTRF